MNVLSAVIAYLLGTIPFAYFFVRRATGKNIFSEGSGNPGAMNSFEVTGDRKIGIIVALLDLLKGIAAVKIAQVITGGNFYAVAMAAVFVVVGHCFNIFFGGRGGRGLAPAAGAMLAMNPLGLIFWCVMYATGYFVVRREVHIGNIAGTLGAPILLYSTPDQIINFFALVPNFNISQYKIAIFLICLQIFFRHLEPIREMFAKDREDEP